MLLQAVNISKSYGTTTVLSHISLQIQERERIGLVGVNGAGKSTFLQIISGEMSYDDGEIFKAKDTRIGYLAQNSGLHSARTIREEMLEVFADVLAAEKELRDLEVAMAHPELHEDAKKTDEIMNRYAARAEWFRAHRGYEMDARIRSVLHGMGFAEFPSDTVVSTLSGGQKTRLALAKMLLQEPDLLILDEPTNHLDIPTLTWLEDYLRGYPGAILVVSHDRYFLDALVQTIYEIERHAAKRYTGNYSRFIEQKAAEYASQLKQYEKQQEEIARMEDFVQRNLARASTTKRAQSRRKALERIERLDKPLGDLKRASFSFEIDRTTGKDVLRADRLALSYDGAACLFRDVSFELYRSEMVALIGPNGIGKSSLLKILTGRHEPFAGSFQWGTNVKLGFYDQEQAGLNPDNTVLDEVWNAYPMLEEVRIRTVLGNFLFSGEDVLKKVAALSGGEKARVSLAKLMLLNANVLILDEPTNHLDLFSKEVLEAALLDYEGTLLFISHDRYFLNKMAERMLELTPSGVEAYLGNYDDYVEKKAELAEIRAKQLADEGKAGSRAAQENGSEGGHAGRTDGMAAFAAGPDVPGPASRAAGRADLGHPAAAAGGTQPAAGSMDIPGNANDYESGKQAKREERSRKRRLEQLEGEIARLEAEIAGLEKELTQPEVYQNYVLVQEKQTAIEERKGLLESHYEEWAELAG